VFRDLSEVYEALTMMAKAQEAENDRDLLHEAKEIDWQELILKQGEAMHSIMDMHLLEDMSDDND